MGQKLTTQQFIDRVEHIYPNKYDYSLVEYRGSNFKIKIICFIHGVFEITANNMLYGQACHKCAKEKDIKARTKTTEQFIIDANIKHNNRYNYSKSIYKTVATKLTITCSIHGDFLQTPNGHLRGNGCPKCNHKPTYSKTEWIDMCNSKICNPLVYIIRCFNDTEEFIKIGITSKSIKWRFRQKLFMPYSYEVLKEIKGSPDFVFDEEHRLHKLYKEYKYKPLISFRGETECFNRYIISLL
jgi:hypothetical protein